MQDNSSFVEGTSFCLPLRRNVCFGFSLESLQVQLLTCRLFLKLPRRHRVVAPPVLSCHLPPQESHYHCFLRSQTPLRHPPVTKTSPRTEWLCRWLDIWTSSLSLPSKKSLACFVPSPATQGWPSLPLTPFPCFAIHRSSSRTSGRTDCTSR